MDLEQELRRVLLERPLPRADDVVPALHAGMRRRVRRRRLSSLGAAAGVLAMWGGAVLLLQQPDGAPRPPAVPTTLIANVPAGFQIRDLTFVSTSRGYGLGTVPCGAGRCTVLLQTDTGTRAWERAPGPLVPAARPDGSGCEQGLCVSQVRFATAADGAEVGYAYGPSYVVFKDGEWRPQRVGHRVEALEAARAGTVVRVLARAGGGHLVQQSTVGSDTWRDVLVVAAPTSQALLRRQGDRLVLVTHDRGVSDVRSSTDGGTTWKKGAHDPCDADTFTSAALAGPDAVVVLCRSGDGRSSVRVSEDDGTRFGAPRKLPAGVRATQVAAPASGGWLVAGELAAEHARVVVRSPDQGATWERVATERAPAGPAASGYLDNSNGRTVWWIGADPRYVWRTDDGGAHWAAARFR